MLEKAESTSSRSSRQMRCLVDAGKVKLNRKGGHLMVWNMSKVLWQDHACDFRRQVRSSTDDLTEV